MKRADLKRLVTIIGITASASFFHSSSHQQAGKESYVIYFYTRTTGNDRVIDIICTNICMDSSPLLTHFKEVYKFSEKDCLKLIQLFEPLEAKKNEHLFRSGEIARHVYYVEKGCWRGEVLRYKCDYN